MSYLTEKQRAVLDYVSGRIRSGAVAPTLQEIADRFGYASTASAQKHVDLLVAKGYLVRAKHQKRGLLLPDPPAGAAHSQLPLLGAVAAGAPIESIPGDEVVTVPSDLIGGGDHFALRVRGESMIDDGIHDGDLVVVQRADRADDGDMVVALVDGEVTLKRLFRRGDRVVLQPANPALRALEIPAGHVRVQGRVVGLLRRY